MGGNEATGWLVPWPKQVEKISGVVEGARKEMANHLGLDPDNGSLKTQIKIFQRGCLAHLLNNATLFIGSTKIEKYFWSQQQTVHVCMFGHFNNKDSSRLSSSLSQISLFYFIYYAC